jgi:hypothetical protein
MGKTFNLPSPERINAIVAIAAILQFEEKQRRFSPRVIYEYGKYFNPVLFREMPHSLENGNRYDEQKKRWVRGPDFPSFFVHIWVKEVKFITFYRRVTTKPAIITKRW